MAKTNRKRVTKRTPKKPARSFGHTLVWTIMLSLVFSAGLIVGQRMLKRSATPALVSVSSVRQSDAPAREQGQEPGQKEEVSFSFYERLGMESAGAPAAQKPKGEGALPARYTLQVGSYPSLQQAQRELRTLKKEGMEAFMVSATVPKKGKMYRVRLGKFHSMDEARQFQAELTRQRDLNTFVMPL